MGFKELATKVGKIWSNNSTKILTVASITGATGISVLSFVQGQKVARKLDDMEFDKKEINGDDAELTPKEKFKAAVPLMIPIVVGTAVTDILIIMNHKINTKQKAALAAAVSAAQTVASISSNEVMALKKKIREISKSDTEADGHIAEAETEAYNEYQNTVTFDVAETRYPGEDYFCIPLIGLKFKTKKSIVQEAINTVNHELGPDGNCSQDMNDFIKECGVAGVYLSEPEGWNTYDCQYHRCGTGARLIYGDISINGETHPGYHIVFDNMPKRDYDND